MATASTDQEYKTCKITVVTPGGSDRVIKVFPAEHESEKVWLDNANGQQRWKEIERTLYNFAPRGEAVPKPRAYHSDSKHLVVPEITEQDIPLVKLDGGVVLKAPKTEESFGEVSARREEEKRFQESDRARLSVLESNVADLTVSMKTVAESLTTLLTRLPAESVQGTQLIDPAPARRGRPPKKQED